MAEDSTCSPSHAKSGQELSVTMLYYHYYYFYYYYYYHNNNYYYSYL